MIGLFDCTNYSKFILFWKRSTWNHFSNTSADSFTKTLEKFWNTIKLLSFMFHIFSRFQFSGMPFFWHLSTSLDKHFSEFWLASLSKIPSARYLLALVVASKASLGFAEYLIQPSFLNLLMNLPLTYRPHGSPYLFRFAFVPGVFIIFNWHILLSHNFF